MSNVQKPSINVSVLTLIIVATILSIKNWPFMAEYGFASLLFVLASMVIFFIPTSLVSAELASGWPENGGVFVWVKEAFGPKTAFLSIWLLWVSNVVWYPTILSFIAFTISYAFDPSLAHNVTYNVCVILALFWTVILGNLFGVKFSSWLSSIAVIFGTLIPGGIIILFGCIWFFSGNPSQLDFSWHALIPQNRSLSELVYLVGALVGFAGMEMNAIHANSVENPRKNYPRAILFSTAIIVVLSILGTLAIGIVIPKENINLVGATMDTISFYLSAYHLEWSLPLFASMVAFGAFGGVSAWLAGTSQGLLTACQETDNLPHFLSKENRHGVPVSILLLQGLIVSLLSLVYVVMPNLSSGFWLLTVLSTQLYILMYILMFLAAIVLRFKRADVFRAYEIPGGKIGLCIVSGLGLSSCLFAFLIGFVPPSQIDTGSILFYEAFLIVGIFAVCLLPSLVKKVMIQVKKIDSLKI